MKVLCFLVSWFLISVVNAVLGVDVSTLTSTDEFTCFDQYGYQFAIVRGYCSYGAVDPNVVANLENSYNSELQEKSDVYFFPCVPCGNPAGQVDTFSDAIYWSSFANTWIDIEVYAWSSNQTANQNFILAMISEFVKQGAHIGIYTNYYNWQSIVGLGWTALSKYPLWYAHYDDSPDFEDFVPFGGWNQPAMKQFNGDATICGVGVNQNYHP